MSTTTPDRPSGASRVPRLRELWVTLRRIGEAAIAAHRGRVPF